MAQNKYEICLKDVKLEENQFVISRYSRFWRQSGSKLRVKIKEALLLAPSLWVPGDRKKG